MLCGDIEAADVNNDDRITGADAIAIVNRIGHQDVTEYDVNCDGKVSAIDAIFTINRIGEVVPPPPPPPPPPADPWDNLNARDVPRPGARVITFHVGGSLSTFGLTQEQVLNGIAAAAAAFENLVNVDFRFVRTGGDYEISTGELYLGNGVHARGWNYPTIGGRHIQLHNGFVSRGHSRNHPDISFNWRAITSERAVQTLLMHEMGHALMRWGHSSSTSCVMHTNGSRQDWCGSERSALLNRYGASRVPAADPGVPGSVPSRAVPLSIAAAPSAVPSESIDLDGNGGHGPGCPCGPCQSLYFNFLE